VFLAQNNLRRIFGMHHRAFYFASGLIFFARSLIDANNEMILHRSRAYSKVKLNHPKNFIIALDDALAKSPTSRIPKVPIPAPLKISEDTVARFIHQKSIRYLGEQRLHNSILAHIGAKRPFLYPIPPWWIEKIEELEIKVDLKISKILWRAFCLYFFLNSTVNMVTRWLKHTLSNRKRVHWTEANYDYFFNLRKNNVGASTNDKVRYNILYWYSNWTKNSTKSAPDHRPNIVYYECKETCQDFTYNNIQYRQAPRKFPAIISFPHKVTFVLWLIIFWLKNLCFTLTSRFQEAFIFEDIVDTKYLTLLDKNQLARNYFFHNETYMHRPLWSYVAEQLGSTCWLYFYSTNNFHIDQEKVEKYQRHLSLMTWSNVITWNKDHGKILASASNKIQRINISPCIWFDDSTPTLQNQTVEDFDILIFDVVPRRPSSYIRMRSNSDIYHERNVIAYLDSIEEILIKNELIGALKHKRQLNNHSSKKYGLFCESAFRRGTIRKLDPTWAAAHYIQKSRFVVCYPLTTAASIAKYYNVPTAYYDPTGLLDIGKGFAGIDVIKSSDELNEKIQARTKKQS
jgi:polysaccharide biosynthesis PFTS motif protein